MGSLTSPADHNSEDARDGAYGLSSLSEKTRLSNHLQMSLQRQHILLLSVGPVWGSNTRPPAQQSDALPTELTGRRLWGPWERGWVSGLGTFVIFHKMTLWHFSTLSVFNFIFSFERLYPFKCHASTGENNFFLFVHPKHFFLRLQSLIQVSFLTVRFNLFFEITKLDAIPLFFPAGHGSNCH